MPTPRREAKSATLAQHIAFIRDMVNRSGQDPETRTLAVKLVSGAFDVRRNPRTGEEELVVKAWGKPFLAPPGPICPSRDDACEIERIWDFLVLNYRYVYDPADEDTFQTLKQTLVSGGGDCDDAVIALAALLKAIGFYVMARVISTQENPDNWVHIYLLVGLAKDKPAHWLPLDLTVEGFIPGNEYDKIADYRDFQL